jgi:formiminotetrahydrofolate cyclodeaminase
MDPEIKQALLFMGKKLESLEDKIDAIYEKVEDIQADLPPNLDEDLSEIKAFLMQIE